MNHTEYLVETDAIYSDQSPRPVSAIVRLVEVVYEEGTFRARETVVSSQQVAFS